MWGDICISRTSTLATTFRTALINTKRVKQDGDADGDEDRITDSCSRDPAANFNPVAVAKVPLMNKHKYVYV